MSTKIYQGFVVEDDSLAAFNFTVSVFRQWVVKQAQKKLDDFMRNSMASGLTQQAAWGNWMDRRARMDKTLERDPAVDTDFNICIIPAEDTPLGSALLGIVFTENPAWFKHWLKQAYIKEYGYWNSTDRPRRVSAREWVERHDVWNGALDLSKPLNLQMYSIDLVKSNLLLTPTVKGKK